MDSLPGLQDAARRVAGDQQFFIGGNHPDRRGCAGGSDVGFDAHGGQGCISVASNVAPRLCAELQNATLAGDFRKALALQDTLMPLFEVLFIETNPAPVKYAAARIGLCGEEARLPMVPVSDATRAAVDAVLAKLGLIKAKAAE